MNETHRTVKRLLSAFLCIVMILALAPMTVFADGENPETPAEPQPTPVSGAVTAIVSFVSSNGLCNESVEYIADGEYTEGALLELDDSKIATAKGEFEEAHKDYTLNEANTKRMGNVSLDSGRLIVNFTLFYDAPVAPVTKTYTISYVYNDFALTPEASATVEEGKSYTVSNTHKDWLGYKFEGWKVNGVGEIVKVLENVQSDITLVASFVKDPTAGKYKVEHYWQNLDGKGYTRYETELKSGVADGTEVAAAGNQAKNYAGLKYDHCEGSSVASVYDENIQGTIKLYYTRNSYDVTYMVDGKQSGKVETYKFGQTVTLRDAPNAKKGYTFVGWEADHALGSGNTMPATNVIFSGRMEPGTGAVYTVNVYRQNVKGDYELYHSQKRTGVVDSITNVTAADVEGYVLQPFTNKTIKADGSTVISVYYEMTDELAAILIATGKTTGNPPAGNLVIPDAGELDLDAEELTAEPADDAQPADAADEQDAADIGEEETPLASGETGLGFNIIPFIILGIIIVAAAIYAYIRHKKQAGENA